MPKESPRASNESPTLPLPPPRAAISLDHFFEAASEAALRALDAHARQSPQPEPWRGNPRIWLGIIIENQHPGQPVNAGELKGSFQQ